MHIISFLVLVFIVGSIYRMTLTLTKNIYNPMSSLVSFASTDSILSLLRSILVVQKTQPTVDGVLIFADREYLLLSASGDLLLARYHMQNAFAFYFPMFLFLFTETHSMMVSSSEYSEYRNYSLLIPPIHNCNLVLEKDPLHLKFH